MKRIVFATNNRHKLDEIRRIVAGRFEIAGLGDIGLGDVDIPETGSTFRENALQKAQWVKDHTGFDCFADDTGLMVDALNGEPGVRSARYAPGEGHDSQANMKLLLRNLEGVKDRSARFVTEIVLLESGEPRYFTGSVEGEILEAPEGEGGFGYDPIFRPTGYTETFATMSPEQKNAISHRGRATQSLLTYLLKA